MFAISNSGIASSIGLIKQYIHEVKAVLQGEHCRDKERSSRLLEVACGDDRVYFDV